MKPIYFSGAILEKNWVRLYVPLFPNIESYDLKYKWTKAVEGLFFAVTIVTHNIVMDTQEECNVIKPIQRALPFFVHGEGIWQQQNVTREGWYMIM